MDSAIYCIFANSKYYRQSSADAFKISQPLGYSFLSKRQEVIFQKSKGPKIRRVLFQKPLIKNLSNKATPLEKVQQHLLVSDSKRKNTYLSSNPLTIINKASEQICQQLPTKYFPQLQKQSKELIDFMIFLSNISEDAIFNINDYALSTFVIFYFGKNTKIKKSLRKISQEQYLEYNIKFISSFSFVIENNSKDDILIQFNQNNLKDKCKIDEYIELINRKGLQLDLMFSGLHLFIGDCIASPSSHEILKEQISNLKYLQFYLYLLTSGILGIGQNALLKIRGTLRHKTIDFLFLFKLVFSKITLVKPQFSNFLSSQRFLLCENYIPENGDLVHKFISENFQLLSKDGQEKLLVNPQLIFKQETLADSVKNFNDTLVVRGLKQVLELFLKNSNLEIYPAKSSLIEKLNNLNQSDQLKQIVKKIEQSLPNEEDIKNQAAFQQKSINYDSSKNLNDLKMIKQPQLEEKEASIDVLNLLKMVEYQKKPSEKPKDIIKKQSRQDQIQERILERFNEQERIRQEKKKQKKQKQKKQKQKQKLDQDPYGYTSRFRYAQQ